MTTKTGSAELRYGHYPRGPKKGGTDGGEPMSSALFIARIVVSWFVLLALTVLTYFLLQGKLQTLYPSASHLNATERRTLIQNSSLANGTFG